MYFIRRGFRRITRKIQRRFRRVTQYQRRLAKTDPKIYDAIRTASTSSMKNTLDRKGSKWVSDKKIKKEVKNKVALSIENTLQRSPMRNMRPLVKKTIDEMIDLTLLREAKKRGPRLKVTRGSPAGRLFWRLIFPIAIAGTIGWLSFAFPEVILPGSLVIPSTPLSPTGAPAPIDPIPILQSALINAAVYGIGAFTLVGIIALMRR